MTPDVEKSSLPQWGWMLLGLFAASVLGNLFNVVVLNPLGLRTPYDVVTVIALMAPVLIYVGIWHDDERAHYWEKSRAAMAGDVAFLVGGTVVGASMALLALEDVGFVSGLLQSFLGMGAGFLAGWLLFWFRNPDLYADQ